MSVNRVPIYEMQIVRGSPDRVAQGYELQNIENRNAAASETVGSLNNTQSPDQLFSTLRLIPYEDTGFVS
jgi:hypothetical protein